MSKTLLTTADVPKYIKEIVARLKLTTDYAENDIPGYNRRAGKAHFVSCGMKGRKRLILYQFYGITDTWIRDIAAQKQLCQW